jgi:hypothetical protein
VFLFCLVHFRRNVNRAQRYQVIDWAHTDSSGWNVFSAMQCCYLGELKYKTSLLWNWQRRW